MKIFGIASALLLLSVSASAEMLECSIPDSNEAKISWNLETGNLYAFANMFGQQIRADIITDEFVTQAKVAREKCNRSTEREQIPNGGLKSFTDKFDCLISDANSVSVTVRYEVDTDHGTYQEIRTTSGETEARTVAFDSCVVK